LAEADNEIRKETLEDEMLHDCKNISAVMAAIIAMTMSGPAGAQLNNKAFAFRNSPGGIGMSYAGKQAILNEKVQGISPDNMQRGPNGILLDVTKEPGHSAIVGYEGNAGFIPGFRGTDFRGGNPYMQAGMFNGFFAPAYPGKSTYTYNDYQTAAVINSWTAAVTSGYMPFSYYNANGPVDSWTSIVYSLNRD
jgi:hypothetical protein